MKQAREPTHRLNVARESLDTFKGVRINVTARITALTGESSRTHSRHARQRPAT